MNLTELKNVSTQQFNSLKLLRFFHVNNNHNVVTN